MLEDDQGLLHKMGVEFHHIHDSRLNSVMADRIEEAEKFIPGGIGGAAQRRKAKKAKENAGFAIRRTAALHNRAEDKLHTSLSDLEDYGKGAGTAEANPFLQAQAGEYGTTVRDLVTGALQEFRNRVQVAYRNVLDTNTALLPELQENHPAPSEI